MKGETLTDDDVFEQIRVSRHVEKQNVRLKKGPEVEGNTCSKQERDQKRTEAGESGRGEQHSEGKKGTDSRYSSLPRQAENRKRNEDNDPRKPTVSCDRSSAERTRAINDGARQRNIRVTHGHEVHQCNKQMSNDSLRASASQQRARCSGPTTKAPAGRPAGTRRSAGAKQDDAAAAARMSNERHGLQCGVVWGERRGGGERVGEEEEEKGRLRVTTTCVVVWWPQGNSSRFLVRAVGEGGLCTVAKRQKA